MSIAPEVQNKITQIQKALLNIHVDGWLLYNFRQSNIFASKILDLPPHLTQMRRYFYYIPAQGVPQKIVHGIEAHNLDHLPGETTVYVSWQSLHAALEKAVRGAASIAMEYSPDNAIPYVSKVDAGTVELIRSFGPAVVSSADIVQYFEARWTEEQRTDQFETCDILRQTVDAAFGFIGEQLKAGKRVTEYDVQQVMARYFVDHGLAYGEAPNCSVNGNGANPHYEPTKEVNAEIHKGDYILIDLWAKKKKPGAVYGDITWVAYAGEAVPPKYQLVFEIVKGARDAAVNYIRKEFAAARKVRGCDVDDVTRKYIADSGYGEYFIHRTGHNIGEEVHGNGAHIDNLETNDRREIIPETCFSIEPGIYLPGEFGVRLEIDVYIGSDRTVHVPGQPIQEEIVCITC